MRLNKHLFWAGLFLMFQTSALSSCSKNKPIEDEGNEDDKDYETLTFTPNESFFSPTGTLTAHLRDLTTGNEYNKNEYYDYITDWKVLSDTIIFGIDIKTAGKLMIKPEMGIPTSQDGSKLRIYVDNEHQDLVLSASGASDTYKIQEEAVFQHVGSGFHIIKLKLESLKDANTGIGNLKNVHVTGPAAKGAETVMRRYRANAVHARWETGSTSPVEISVHELTVISKSQDFYQPITTPFGYTGSTWNKNTQTFGVYNFSLWSYGANDPVPPFYQESHLIAVGPGLEFDSYGHEGTGVKPRGPHPYVGVPTNIQTIAVRMAPGAKYDTFWSYYLDPKDGHWKLYGCGKTFNASGTIKHLTTGAFVEVPGGAHKVRNGNVIAETHYRGWQMDVSGNWHPINRMVGTSGQNNTSFRDWKVVGDKFSMQMGGWGEPGIEKKTLTISNPAATPAYLKGPYLDELYKMPADFTHHAPLAVSSNSATLRFNITNLGTNASAEIFWGKEEGLTKEEKWQATKAIHVGIGDNTVTLDGLEEDTAYFYRIRIKNNEGITWSFDTQTFTTGL